MLNKKEQKTNNNSVKDVAKLHKLNTILDDEFLFKHQIGSKQTNDGKPIIKQKLSFESQSSLNRNVTYQFEHLMNVNRLYKTFYENCNMNNKSSVDKNYLNNEYNNYIDESISLNKRNFNNNAKETKKIKMNKEKNLKNTAKDSIRSQKMVNLNDRKGDKGQNETRKEIKPNSNSLDEHNSENGKNYNSAKELDNGVSNRRQSPNLPNKKTKFPNFTGLLKINPAIYDNLKYKMKRLNRMYYNCNAFGEVQATSRTQLHADELLKFLSKFYHGQQLCDLEFKIITENSEHKFPAHRIALAMFSEKYKVEFSNIRSGGGVHEIQLNETSNTALLSILNYIYSGIIDINPINAEAILNAASEMGIDDIIYMATDYINSFSIGDLLIFISNYFLKDGPNMVIYEIYTYFMNNLYKISLTPEYLRATLETIKIILCDSNLCVENEIEVFNAAMKWYQYDKVNRVKLLPNVLDCVRFTQIDPKDLHKKTSNNPVFKQDKALVTKLLNAFKYHTNKNSQNPNTEIIAQCEEPRMGKPDIDGVPADFVDALDELTHLALEIKIEKSNTVNDMSRLADYDIEYQSKCQNSNRSRSPHMSSCLPEKCNSERKDRCCGNCEAHYDYYRSNINIPEDSRVNHEHCRRVLQKYRFNKERNKPCKYFNINDCCSIYCGYE